MQVFSVILVLAQRGDLPEVELLGQYDSWKAANLHFEREARERYGRNWQDQTEDFSAGEYDERRVGDVNADGANSLHLMQVWESDDEDE